VHRLFSTVAVVLAVASVGHRTSAQTLTSSLFERYLETLREQAGIPGMSALVSQNGVAVWEQGFGRADVDTGERAAPYTPYLIGDLSQMFGATLLLRTCGEQGSARPDDLVSDWIPFREETTTLGHLAAHITPSNTFKYDRARFAALTGVIEECSGTPYPQLLDDEILERLGMADSAPGTRMSAPTPQDRELFAAGRLDYLGAVLRRVATPYTDRGGRMVRADLAPTGVDASFGIVSSVRDLAKFDAAVDKDDLLLQRSTRQFAWTRPASHLPSGVGWFVQNYNGTEVVWQFGVVAGAYSSLIIKVPDRSLTFILLANSDKLSTPFALENGDVTTSVFAKLFLRLYVP
jgi:CubicO group peptidase (beta-lactamase class C family)